MMEQRPGTDQVQPSLKQDGTGTSHNTDLSLFPHLATINSSAEISAVSIRPRARPDLRKQHLLCSVAISARFLLITSYSSHYQFSLPVINPFFLGTLYLRTLGGDFRIGQKVPALSLQHRNCCRDGTGTTDCCYLQRNFSCRAAGRARAVSGRPMHRQL